MTQINMHRKMIISFTAAYSLLFLTPLPSRAAEAKKPGTGAIEGIVVASEFSIPGRRLTVETKEFIPKTKSPLRYVFEIQSNAPKAIILGDEVEKVGSRLKVEYENLNLSEMDYFYQGKATRIIKIMDPSVNSNPLLGRMKTAADREAAKRGYDTGNMVVDLDENNSKWKKSSGAQQRLSQNISKIEGKDYIAVYYHPIPPPGHATMGGDLWVFVDRTTAEVITVLRGQ